MPTIIDYDLDARKKLQAGVDKFAKAVVVTLGPRGRNVVFEKSDGSPQMSCDGVTVAKQIELSDPVEELGIRRLCCRNVYHNRMCDRKTPEKKTASILTPDEML
jgi:chaperonin GroEL